MDQHDFKFDFSMEGLFRGIAMSHMTTQRRFTVDEYEQMIEEGILKPNDRVELIRGEIQEMSPIGDAHSARLSRINFLLVMKTAGRAIVNPQLPIVLADSEPQPDFAVLRYRPDFYDEGKARPGDVLLLIEISNSTLEFDREVKGLLYAEAGIPEYWIVNLVDHCLEVYRRPTPRGYKFVQTLNAGDEVEIPGIGGQPMAVSEFI